MAQFPIKDFSGGITDYIFTADIKHAEVCDNLLINRERGLETRDGSELYSYDEPRPEAERTRHLIDLYDVLYNISKKNIYYYSSGWNSLPLATDTQIDTDNVPFDKATDDTIVDYDIWRNHILVTTNSDDGSTGKWQQPIKIYEGDSGIEIRTAGLPKYTEDDSVSIAEDTGTGSFTQGHVYQYKLVWHYKYVSDGVTYEDFGTPSDIIEHTVSGASVGKLTLSNLSNEPIDSTFNHFWATQDVDGQITLQIYRTKVDGPIFYYVAEIDYADIASGYPDQTLDSSFSDDTVLYTTGGVLGNDIPPRSKYITVVNDIAWYANIQNDGLNDELEELSFRVVQSVQSDPDSVPAGNFVDLDSAITGMSSVGNYPIVMTENGTVYRLEGYFDELGIGSITPRVIDDKAGCVSHKSIVRTFKALYWAGVDGFYMSDGFNVVKISPQINDTYNNLTGKSDIYGAYDKINNRIYWSYHEESFSEDNDKIFVCEERMPFEFNSSIALPFTTISAVNSKDADGDQEKFSPTAIVVVDGNLIRGSSDGYVYAHSSELFNDADVNNSLIDDPTNIYYPVIYDWKHIACDFGHDDIKKWVSSVTIGAQNISNLDMGITSFDEGASKPKTLKELDFENKLTWGSEEWIWKDDLAVWQELKHISKSRRMPKGKLRTRYKQLRLSNSYSVISWSEKLCDTFQISDYDPGSAIITFDTDKTPVFNVSDDIRILDKSGKIIRIDTTIDSVPSTYVVKLTAGTTLIRNSDYCIRPNKATVSGTTVTLNDDNYYFPTKAIGYKIRFSNDSYTNEYEITARVSDSVLTIESEITTDFQYADEASRLAALFSEDDIGKICVQLDTSDIYIITSVNIVPPATIGTANWSDKIDWEIVGYKKNQKLALESIIYNFEFFGNREGFYKSKDIEGNK